MGRVDFSSIGFHVDGSHVDGHGGCRVGFINAYRWVEVSRSHLRKVGWRGWLRNIILSY